VTLIELLIAMTLLAIIGASLVKLLMSQVRFADTQIAAKDAREASRATLNVIASDIGMVDADSGVIVATADSFTVLAPYALGMVCGTSAGGSGSVIALLPYDSASYAEGGYSGYAYVDTTTTGTQYTQVYQYKYTTTNPTTMDSATAATTSPCRTATDQYGLFGSGAVIVQPVIPTKSIGQAAFLFRRITYSFKPSTTISGARGLYRRVINGTRGAEEIMAPFDASAKFMYAINDGTTAASAGGATLNKIRGIQLQLTGISDHVVAGASVKQSAPLSTTIFFKNRPRQ